jgi:sugar phosphate isomerase/epimerase
MITTGIIDPHAPETARILRTAARLGVRYYRLGVFAYEANLPVWDALLKQKPVFRELAELGRTHGLHGAVQNHSGARVSSAVWDLFELFRDLDPRWIGCQYDVRHAVVEGALSWPLGMKLLAPWIRTTDLKDFVWQQSGGRATPVNVPLGEGVVRYEEYFRLVRDLKIAGPISVHFEYGPFERSAQPLTDPVRRSAVVQALRKDLATLQGWLRRHQLS